MRYQLREIIDNIYGKLTSKTRISRRFLKRMTQNRIENISGVLDLQINQSADFKKNYIYNSGNNTLIIGKDTVIRNSIIKFSGSNNVFSIGNLGLIRDAEIHLGDNGNVVSIGDRFDSGSGLTITSLEGAKISIGNDNMFSRNVIIRNSDGHSIINEFGERINMASDISIGDYNWFGEDVVCLKGANVGNNCVVGIRSMLTKGEYHDGLYVGIPAKKKKDKVKWNVNR